MARAAFPFLWVMLAKVLPSLSRIGLDARLLDPACHYGRTMTKKSKVVKPGVVEKIIKSPYEPEKAQIAIKGADHLYKRDSY